MKNRIRTVGSQRRPLSMPRQLELYGRAMISVLFGRRLAGIGSCEGVDTRMETANRIHVLNSITVSAANPLLKSMAVPFE